MDSEDHFPPERISEIKRGSSRTEYASFMHAFRYEVMKKEEFPPPHWLIFAAELLGGAADVVNVTDAREREREVTKALGLTARQNFTNRNRAIAMAIHRLAKNNRSNRQAALTLAEQLAECGVTVPEDTLLSIYNRSNRDELDAINACGLDVINPGVMDYIRSYYI